MATTTVPRCRLASTPRDCYTRSAGLAGDGAWSEDGISGLDFVVHLGLVGSYLPMFGHLPELYAGAISGARRSGRRPRVARPARAEQSRQRCPPTAATSVTPTR